MHIQRLFIFPIKSLLPVEVEEAEVTHTGFKYDRSFILIDGAKANNQANQPSSLTRHLTIKTLSKLCLFQPSIDASSQSHSSPVLRVRHTLTNSEIAFPLAPVLETLQHATEFTIEIFGTRATGIDMGNEIAAWFSNHLERSARLLYIGNGGSGMRDIVAPALIPRKQQSRSMLLSSWLHGEEEELHEQKIQFADAAPLLITTVSSERDASSRVPRETVMDGDEDVIIRFRSNIHIDNTASEAEHAQVMETGEFSLFPPYAEEQWKTLEIFPTNTAESDAPLHLDLVFNTVRCQSLNVDFRTGGLVPPERQLYKLLAKDRHINPAFPYKPCFGRYAFAEPFGRKVRVGDVVVVKERVN
ncbi:hypothetical protein H2200_006579 [Cladophialophora chaetospira]|uniref:MOSC domain-containing protein n=1 Tax=Cladophialophora chaetospira TaxID=386627 RepID=A0AA38X8G8_9EURO|nr:hypothetical protein H2200_006579 [Cladophialophora chaetospira]